MRLTRDMFAALGYADADPELDLLLRHFDETPPGSVLEVGGNDAPLAQVMAQAGWAVHSVDLKPHRWPPVARHTHAVGDFTTTHGLDGETFDVAVSVSAIEHFGMGTYGDPKHPYLDAVACHRVWALLKPGGRFYCVIPIGGRHVERPPHFRVYDYESMLDRVVQRLWLRRLVCGVVEDVTIDGRPCRAGDPVSWPDVLSNQSGSPALAALVVAIKP